MSGDVQLEREKVRGVKCEGREEKKGKKSEQEGR